jgi:hypothetical protein
VRLSGAHSVSISGPFGVAKKRIPAADLAEVLPGEVVTLHASFDDVPATALAFTKVRLDPSGAGDDGAELSTVTGGAITLAPPITVVLLALAVGLALRARRAYRRHGQQDVPREVRLT